MGREQTLGTADTRERKPSSLRSYLAICVILCGLALMPAVGLSNEVISWHLFAKAYGPPPAAVIPTLSNLGHAGLSLALLATGAMLLRLTRH